MSTKTGGPEPHVEPRRLARQIRSAADSHTESWRSEKPRAAVVRLSAITCRCVRRGQGGRGLEQALDELSRQSSAAIAEGYGIIILSDRGVSREKAPIPALLAVSDVHHHLIRQGTRTQVGLVIESGEPREVHHFALLLGYGAAAINPYLAFETLRDMACTGLLAGLSAEQAIKNYVKAVDKGIVKVISKMGISTVQSYCGAQIFEALGGSDFVTAITWTSVKRIGGVGLNVIAEEALLRHSMLFQNGRQ